MLAEDLETEAKVQAGFMYDRSRRPTYKALVEELLESEWRVNMQIKRSMVPRFAAMILSELNWLHEQENAIAASE